MGIREQAQADIGRILGNPEGLGTPFDLVDKDGAVYPVCWTFGDISLLIDPQTGTAVQGRTITAVYPMALLAERTDTNPVKGWRVNVKALDGKDMLLVVCEPPDHDFTIGLTRLRLGPEK